MAIVRRTYVISDLHLGGAYGRAEDPNDRGFRLCSQVPALTDWVDELARRPAEGPQVELVINGDLVDFLAEGKGSSPAWTPFVSNGREAAAKLHAIIARDHERLLFEALSRFLDRGHRLVVLLGNHDTELALPDVRRMLVNELRITGRHDFQFIYDGEAYVVGDALIEHGNRYDKWNTVDHNSLRQLRSWQSRSQPEAAYHRFVPSAGSQLVSDVINPIKSDYPFVDLLKPETAAVIPILLALEPGYRSRLLRIAALWTTAVWHTMTGPAHPPVDGDIASRAAASIDIGGDLGATPLAGPTAQSGGLRIDPLHAALEGVMPGAASAFLRRIDEALRQDASIDTSGDIASTGDTINRTLGVMRLLTSGRSEPLERRLRILLQAVRVLQSDRTFDRDVETLPEYVEAAKALSQCGFRFVVFGHTHLARNVRLGSDATYLNSGTWTDRIRFPGEILGGSERQALEALRAFVLDMAACRLTGWVSFVPTYVLLHVNDSGRVAYAELVDAVRGKSQ